MSIKVGYMGRIQALNKLGKILIGDKNVVNESIDSIIKHIIHGNMTSVYIYYLKTGLESGIIKPDKLLVDSIVNIIEGREEYEDIRAENLLSLCIPMCLALRYGANTNVIINNMHMLVYVYLELDGNIDDRIFDMIVTILLLSGVDVDLPAFEFDEEQSKTKNVMEYLSEENHSIDIKFVNMLKQGKIPDNIPWILGALLDNTDLIHVQSQESFLTDMFGQHIDFNLCIYIHASKFIPRIYKSEYMCTAIRSLNLEAFVQLIHINCSMEYTIVNDLVISYKTYRQLSDVVCEGVITKMLEMSISKGVKLDRFQMEYIPESLRNIQEDKIENTRCNNVWMIPELDRELIDCLIYKQGEEYYNFEIKDLDTIIATKKNIYTNTDIETWYISKIRSQRSALKRLGLTKPQKVNIEQTDNGVGLNYEDMLNNMCNVGMMYGITREDIIKINVKQMCVLCKLLNIDVSITCLNPQHRLPTFIYTVYPIICKPDMCELLYKGIQETRSVT